MPSRVAKLLSSSIAEYVPRFSHSTGRKRWKNNSSRPLRTWDHSPFLAKIVSQISCCILLSFNKGDRNVSSFKVLSRKARPKCS